MYRCQEFFDLGAHLALHRPAKPDQIPCQDRKTPAQRYSSYFRFYNGLGKWSGNCIATSWRQPRKRRCGAEVTPGTKGRGRERFEKSWWRPEEGDQGGLCRQGPGKPNSRTGPRQGTREGSASFPGWRDQFKHRPRPDLGPPRARRCRQPPYLRAASSP